MRNHMYAHFTSETGDYVQLYCSFMHTCGLNAFRSLPSLQAGLVSMMRDHEHIMSEKTLTLANRNTWRDEIARFHFSPANNCSWVNALQLRGLGIPRTQFRTAS